MTKPQIWAAQFRANFLLLAVVLCLLGFALAVKYHGSITVLDIILLLIGVVSAHISVNLFNEYSDYHTKIDFHTKRTPFSGGTGMMVSGKTTPAQVKKAALITLFIGLAVGTYYVVESNWVLLIFIAIGAFSILFYTNFLAKLMLGELFTGLALGTLVVLGVFIAITAKNAVAGAFIPLEVILLSIPPGILTAQLLLLNEFPDVEADIQGGRRHLVIQFGRKNAAIIYILGHVANYSIIILLPILGISTFWIYIALLTIPFAVKASKTSLHFNLEEPEKNFEGMGKNVLTVLITDFLLFAAIIIELLVS